MRLVWAGCILTALVLLLTGISFSADDTQSAESIDSVAMAGGTLKIVKSTAYHFRIMRGEKILGDEEGLSVDVAGAYPKGERPTAVFLQINSGGTGCPAMYRIVSMPSKSEESITRRFGNCSDMPTIKNSPDGFHLKFPAFQKAEAETWDYKNGQLRRTDREKAATL